MRKPKLTDEQIVAVLREAERGEKPILDICKKAGVTEQTFYRWRKKFAGNTVNDVRKLKQLEKDKTIAEDESFKVQTEVQKLTDRYIQSIDQAQATKEKDLITP